MSLRGKVQKFRGLTVKVVIVGVVNKCEVTSQVREMFAHMHYDIIDVSARGLRTRNENKKLAVVHLLKNDNITECGRINNNIRIGQTTYSLNKVTCKQCLTHYKDEAATTLKSNPPQTRTINRRGN